MQTPTQTLYRYIQDMKIESEFNDGTVICLSDDQQEAINEHSLHLAMTTGVMNGKTTTGIEYLRHADKEDFSCGDEFTFFTIVDADKFQAFVEGMDFATGAVEQEIEEDFNSAMTTIQTADGHDGFRTEWCFARKARRAVETQARTDVLRNRLADAGYTVEEYNEAQKNSFFADPQPAVLDAVSMWGFPCGLVESLNA
jgi:hypothetical protein